MLYVFAVTIPPSTTALNPLKVDMPLTAGDITRVMIQFPPGLLGLASIKIIDGLHQVWPSNEGASFATDSETIAWEEEYALDAAPYDLQAVAWNLDDTYPHTITVRIEVDSAQAELSVIDQVRQLLGIGGGA